MITLTPDELTNLLLDTYKTGMSDLLNSLSSFDMNEKMMRKKIKKLIKKRYESS